MSELSLESKEKFKRICNDLPLFAKNFLIIHDKDGCEKKFYFNRAQSYVHERLEAQLRETGKIRALILKGRQQGISTYVQARFFRHIVNSAGKKAFILTHQSDATSAIFEMTKRYSENIDPAFFPQPYKKNDNKLMYDKPISSGYRVGTAGNENIGRSMTNQYLHMSEYAFYKKAGSINLGLMQTVSDLDGTEVIKESTANGQSNSFYREWEEARNGKSRYQIIFVPWYWQEEYTVEIDKNWDSTSEEREWLEQFCKDGLTEAHLNWRRMKLSEMEGDEEQKCRKFKQEYPFTAQEAFLSSVTDTFIQAEHVHRARNNKVESNSALIIGVDPARMGGDRTAIIRRKGRKVFGMQTHYNIDTMRLVGIVRRIIEDEKPARVYVDCIGIGAGIVDRLNELGYDCVVGINVARRAEQPDKYKNIRAELWDRMREWFIQDIDVEIPDSDELESDLVRLGYHYDSSDRLQIEGKEDAKKRGLLSPDTADALMLTYYGGEYVIESVYKNRKVSERSMNSLI